MATPRVPSSERTRVYSRGKSPCSSNSCRSAILSESFIARTSVDPPRVPAMCLADGATQALGGLRDNDQVNMIGHQAICSDRDLLCAAELRHELEVVLAVFLTEECLLSGVSPLGDMVGHARSYHTCQLSHGGKLTGCDRAGARDYAAFLGFFSLDPS